MLKIVIDGNVTKEQISRYLQENNITGTEGIDYEIISRQQYDNETAAASVSYLIQKMPDVNIIPPMSNTEFHQRRTDRQKRDQEKWQRRFYRHR